MTDAALKIASKAYSAMCYPEHEPWPPDPAVLWEAAQILLHGIAWHVFSTVGQSEHEPARHA